MRVLYYECKSGISGDMNLGALLDVGVDKSLLLQELSKLGLDHKFKISVEKSATNGISGTKVTVNEIKPLWSASSHEHRDFKTIKKIIESSSLDEAVKKRSIDMFWELAIAEGKIHSRDPLNIEFHEVGAIDSIVDIVGSAICLEALHVEKIICSSVELGGGFVKCTHGLIPVPAPATVELLKGVPVTFGATNNETTTPTGAAILKCSVDEFVKNPTLKVEKIGYGIGQKRFDIPNLLRVFIGEIATCRDKQIVVETNLDDMSPEVVAYTVERLFELGVNDAYTTPITTKKNRLGAKLSVLCTNELLKSVEELIFNETTSIGLRFFEVKKVSLPRVIKKVQTTYGQINVKCCTLPNGTKKYKPEFDECKDLAKKHSVTFMSVWESAKKVAQDE